ncbi:MAG: sugar ABC transporter substrate-binding protein [Opitutaceae bacterium]|nr:sugar ABC transporter substrate-binding protein [Opitutaceae bacterium]
MKSRILLALLLCLAVLACTKKSDVVELQNWNFGGLPQQTAFLRERVAEFNRTHPGIEVTQSDKSWNMIREILYANFTAAAGPDIMNTHANYAAEFSQAGYYYPINQFPDFPEVKQWFEPHLMASTEYEGNYYGLPANAIAFVLTCNQEMFDRAGLKPPKTWSEFRAAARQLTQDTDGDGVVDQYGLVLMGGDKGGFAYRLIPFFYKAGADVMSEDLTQIAFNSPRGVEALQLFADMHQQDGSITPGFLAYTHSEVSDLFANNKAAMSIEGPWFRRMIEDKVPGKGMYVVPVPVPDDRIAEYDTASTLQDLVMYSINARSKHLQEAWELVKFLRNPESDQFWITEDFGALACTTSALQSPEAAKVPDLPVYLRELQHARPWPAHPQIIAIARNVFTPECLKAIVGEITPQTALDRAAREAQRMVDEHR